MVGLIKRQSLAVFRESPLKNHNAFLDPENVCDERVWANNVFYWNTSIDKPLSYKLVLELDQNPLGVL